MFENQGHMASAASQMKSDETSNMSLVCCALHSFISFTMSFSTAPQVNVTLSKRLSSVLVPETRRANECLMLRPLIQVKENVSLNVMSLCSVLTLCVLDIGQNGCVSPVAAQSGRRRLYSGPRPPCHR